MKTQSKLLPGFALVLCLAAGAAMAQQPDEGMKPMTKNMSEKMLSMPMTGNADVDFARMMREHHLGGIDMARWEVQHGHDPKMKAMARKIIASQSKEVGQFDQWLSAHGGKDRGAEMGGPPQRHPRH